MTTSAQAEVCEILNKSNSDQFSLVYDRVEKRAVEELVEIIKEKLRKLKISEIIITSLVVPDNLRIRTLTRNVGFLEDYSFINTLKPCPFLVIWRLGGVWGKIGVLEVQDREGKVSLH